jgi:HSP20 family protein
MAVLRFEPFRDPFDRLMSLATTGNRSPLGMPLDIYRTKDGTYHVETDLPGVDPSSIDITLEHSSLTIKAERNPRYGEDAQIIVAERPQGSFSRLLTLGEGMDSEHLTADYADGVLHVTIPASPKVEPRRIGISHAEAGSHAVSGGGNGGSGGGPASS